MNKRFIALLVVLLFVFTPLFAVRANSGDVSWRNPKDIYGGRVSSIQTAEDGALYLSTDSAIFKSSDGKNWTKLPFTFAEGANVILASRYFKKGAIIIGTKDSGVFMSRDQGSHWQFLNMGLESSFIVGLAESENGELFALSFDGLLMKWAKNGGYWETISRFPKPLATTLSVKGDTLYVGCENGTVYTVNTDGKNKTVVADKLTDSPVSKVLFSPSDMVCITTFYDGVFIGNKGNFDHELKGYKINDALINQGSLIVATVENGILTNNNGRGWKEIAKKVGVIPSCLTLDKNGNILVGTLGNGVFEIDENGDFTKSSYGITGADVLTINFSTNYTSDNTVFVGTKWNGLFTSNDKGKTFTLVSNFPENSEVKSVYGDSNKYFVGTYGKGMFRTLDSGKTFTNVSIGTQFINVMFGDGNVIYVGSGDKGIFVSNDGGDTFTASNNGILPFDLNITAIDGVKGNVFIGTNGGNVYETTNNGESWAPVGTNSIPRYSIADISVSKNFAEDHTIVVGTTGGGIYLSKNAGSSFMNISDALLKFHMWADGVKLSPNYSKDHIILTGSWDGVYLSFDSGNMWKNINGNKDNRYVYRTVFSPDFVYQKSGAIFVATESGGLYIYDQKGKTVVKMVIDHKGMLVNGRFVQTDVAPVIKNSRTLVPIRFVTEAIGANVSWDGKLRKVTIELNGNVVELFIGKNTAYVNGSPRQIDPNNSKVVPVILHNRTFVPIRFIMEAFGAKVGWDPNTRTVTIEYGG